MKRFLLVSLFESLHVAAQVAMFVLWAVFFGAGSGMDAYLVSAALPMVIAAVTVGPLVSSLVPILVEAKMSGPGSGLAGFRSTLFNLSLLGGAFLAFLLFLASAPLVRLFAPGLGPEAGALAAGMLRVQAFSIPPAICGGVLVSFYYSEDRYYWPTIVPFFGILAAIALLVFCQHRLGIRALAWGSLLSALVQAVLLLGALRGHSWRLERSDDRLRKLVCRLLPLLGGNAYYKSDPLVDRFILSFLPAGSISYLGYGQRAMSGITQVLARGLVTTRFSGLAAAHCRSQDEFRAGAERLFVRACVVVAPLAACLLLFTRPLLHLVMERGAFTAADVRFTAAVVIAFLGVLIGGLLGSVMSSVYYAMGDTRTITLIGMAAFTAGIVLKAAGVLLFSFLGVAIGTSIYFLLAVILEMAVLQKRLAVFSWPGTGGRLLRVLAAALAATAAGAVFKARFGGGAFALSTGALLVLAVYLLLSIALGTVTRSDLRGLIPGGLRREA